MDNVIMFTDGGCLGNPGKGGYGTILVFENDCVELSAGYRHTTNNRMELVSCIVGLEALDREYAVTVYSDSKYLVDSVSRGWATNWKENGWRRSNRSRAENIDLWDHLLSLIQKHRIKFVWVKGHNGHPENERCDQLATAAAHGSNLLEDVGYTGREV